MDRSKLIRVDFSQEAATSEVILRPDLASQKEDWQGIYLQYHNCPPHETPEHYPTQHVVAIQTWGKLNAERQLGDRLKQEQIYPGDVCFVPANTRHQIRTEAPQGLILLSIEPNLIERVAPQAIREKVEFLPRFAHSDPFLSHLGMSLKKALSQNTIDSRFYAESLSTAIVAHLLQFYTSQPLEEASEPVEILQAKDYIQTHLTGKLSLDAIANAIGSSKYHFCHSFKQATGIAPWQYVIQQRIKLAKQLLKDNRLSIVQVSDRLGYRSPSQFSNFFRQHVGVTPSVYRNQ